MSSPSCSIEWRCSHAGVARLHPTPDGRIGDPYDWAATVFRTGDWVEIAGVCRPLSPSGWRAVDAALIAAGVRGRDFIRIKDGVPRKVTKVLTPTP